MTSGRKIEALVNITGRVQGVGFRPFIFRKAMKFYLNGFVINLGDAGVEVVVEGLEKNIHNFLKEVKDNAPEVSDISNIKVEYYPFRNRFTEFKIDKSKSGHKIATGIFPPDIGICSQCLEDMNDKNGRWYNYPFTACAWCGPRFSAIKSLPYDRERTHMHKFPMCNDCNRDYYDTMDRRFDAQGITCSQCGPQLSLYNSKGERLKVKDIYRKVRKLLLEGKIIAIKGIGGIHLSSIATQDEVLEEFRRRKHRPNQPFALMSPSIEVIKSYTSMNKQEENILKSWRKPIILLKKKKNIISEIVAPGLNRVGVMLPYTGIQTMLFKNLDTPALVMTSGNKPGIPMSINNQDALEKLKEIADYYLLHNREIINRVDDSVLKVINGSTSFIRRSRGYVPDPINIPLLDGLCIAYGGELRNNAAIITNGKAFMTQYIGDISTLESLEFEKKAIQKMCDTLNVTRNPDVIACDIHPDYMTSHLSEVISQKQGIELIKTQHHHSHIVSVAAENNIDPTEEILGLALDGAGYGTDGAIWGGEALKSTFYEFERLGHLENIPMPGGDLCTYYPYRMLISSLSQVVSDEEIRDITHNHIKKALPHKEKELDVILKQIKNGNYIKTSSSGRFLDSISALLDLCYIRTYEGEPAMKLEALADKGKDKHKKIEPLVKKNNRKYVLNTSNILYNLFKMKKTHKIQDIALLGQKYLSDGVINIIKQLSDDTGIKKVALTGGVLVNTYIYKSITLGLNNSNLQVFHNKKIPPGDGGIALGQGCIALKSVI